MECTVIWTPIAQTTFENNLSYLKQNWDQRVIDAFSSKTVFIIDFIARHPTSFANSAIRKNVRSVLVVKQIRLYYKYYLRKKCVVLIAFFYTRHHPKKLKIK